MGPHEKPPDDGDWDVGVGTPPNDCPPVLLVELTLPDLDGLFDDVAVGVSLSCTIFAEAAGSTSSRSPSAASDVVAGDSPDSGATCVKASSAAATAIASPGFATRTASDTRAGPYPSSGGASKTGTPGSGGVGGTYGASGTETGSSAALLVKLFTSRRKTASPAARRLPISALRRACGDGDALAPPETPVNDTSRGVTTTLPLLRTLAKMEHIAAAVAGSTLPEAVVSPDSENVTVMMAPGEGTGVGVELPTPPAPIHAASVSYTSVPSRHSVPAGVTARGAATPPEHW